jgi:hypothetical protein
MGDGALYLGLFAQPDPNGFFIIPLVMASPDRQAGTALMS